MHNDAHSVEQRRHRRTLDHRFRIDATVRPGGHGYVVSVSGDFDTVHAQQLFEVVQAGFKMGLPTVLRFDGLGTFGSSGARTVRRLLDAANDVELRFTIEAVPPTVINVFDVVGLRDGRIHPSEGPDGPAPLSAAVFDAVMATGALRTREPICITTHDAVDPRIVFVNEAFANLTGYTADDLLGCNPRLLQGPLTDRSVIAHLKTCLVDNVDFVGETVNYRSDGTPFLVNWNIVSIAYGSQQYFMALQRDVTDLRQLSRLTTARDRLTRSINNSSTPATKTQILDSLGRAAAVVAEPGDIAFATAVTDSAGQVVAANLEGSYLDRSVFSKGVLHTYEPDDTATLHLPFEVDDELTGHLVASGIHRDWLRLIRPEHLSQLCDDCVSALRNADN